MLVSFYQTSKVFSKSKGNKVQKSQMEWTSLVLYSKGKMVKICYILTSNSLSFILKTSVLMIITINECPANYEALKIN